MRFRLNHPLGNLLPFDCVPSMVDFCRKDGSFQPPRFGAVGQDGDCAAQVGSGPRTTFPRRAPWTRGCSHVYARFVSGFQISLREGRFSGIGSGKVLRDDPGNGSRCYVPFGAEGNQPDHDGAKQAFSSPTSTKTQDEVPRELTASWTTWLQCGGRS